MIRRGASKPGVMDMYDPPPSLWEYVQSKIPPTEHDEVQRILGYALINKNETLHDEARALLSIWRDLRKDHDEEATSPVADDASGLLREPPLIRELVTNEVRFLGENLAMLLHNGTSTQAILKMGSEILSREEVGVLMHVVKSTEPMSSGHERGGAGKKKPVSLGKVVVLPGRGAGACPRVEPRDCGAPVRSTIPTSSRPQSARTRDGHEVPLVNRSQLERPQLDAEMSSVIDRLSVFNVDNAVGRIRTALMEEEKALLQDVEFLNRCIIEEYDHHTQKIENDIRLGKRGSQANTGFPSIRTLQAVAAVLQQIYNERSESRPVSRRSKSAISSLGGQVFSQSRNGPRLQPLAKI